MGARSDVWSLEVLVHRLPLDDATQGSPVAELSSYAIDTVGRVSAESAAGALALADLAGLALLARASGASAAWTPASFGSLTQIGAGMVLWLLVARTLGLYRSSAIGRLGEQLHGVLLAAFLACWMVMLTAGLGASVQDVVWLRLGVGAGAMAMWIIATRLAWSGVLRMLLRRGFCLERGLVLAGNLAAARIMAADLERRAGGRLRVVASAPMPGCAGGVTLSWITHAVRANRIGKVFVAERAGAPAATNAVAFELVGHCADVTVLPLTGAPYRMAALEPDMLPLADRPGAFSAIQAAIKRICDIVVAALCLLMGSPVTLIIALAIKADSKGPVLFHQTRWGINNSTFRIRKFRTMYAHLEDPDCAKQTGRDDNRVTRVGRFLRKTSLDELPQLLNVLTGEMSMVGPRPHAVGMKVAGCPPEALVDDYDMRHAVKPGITGWAQVNGCRGELDSKRALWRRMALDSYYIRNRSLRLDAVIMLRTARLMLMDRHAY